MLLMTLDIHGTTRRISNEELPLEHQWFAELSRPPTVKYATRQLYGGMVAPTFGSFQTIPTTFTETTWPPPATIEAIVQHTETTEAEAVELFRATCQRSGFDRTGVNYNTHHKQMDKERTATGFNDPLLSIFQTYCGASWLNLTLDSTMYRAPAGNIVYTLSNTAQILDVLSDIAAHAAHLFYIEDGTLYLVDMHQDNGTLTLDEFDFLPVTYSDGQPYATYRIHETTISGSAPHGGELSVTPVMSNASDRTARLGFIKTIMESPRAIIRVPLNATSASIKPGKRLEWTDESQGEDVTAWIRARSINYDFGQDIIFVEGEGGIA